MPEETVTYRVEIDDSDLGSQLDAVRQRIDTAVGDTAIRTMQTSNSQAALTDFPLLAPQFTAAPVNRFSESIDENFWSKTTGVVNDLQKSYTRFTDDLRDMSILDTTQAYPSFQNQGMLGAWGDFVQGGYAPTWMGFGSGFRYTGEITPGEASLAARARTEKRIQGIVGDYGWDVAGVGFGGLIGGIPGAMIGWTVGSIAEDASNLLLSRRRERQDMGVNLRSISGAAGASVTSSEAEALVGDIQNMFSSPEQRARGFSIQSAEEGIASFANAGGYQNVRGIEEFRSTTMGLLDNFKQVAADMNMSFSEAAQFMGNLQQNMISTTQNVSAITARMNNVATMVGMDPKDLNALGMQGAEMFRGTGLGMESGYMMAIDSRLQAERLTRTGDDDMRRIIAEAGGASSYALDRTKLLTGMGMSQNNQLPYLAMLNGYNGEGGTIGMLTNVGGLVSQNPMMLFASEAWKPQIVGGMLKQGGSEISLRAIQSSIGMLKSMGGFATDNNGKVYYDVLIGKLAQDYNISINDATRLIKEAQAQTSEPSRAELVIEDFARTLQTSADTNPPIPWFTRVRAEAGSAIDDFLDIEAVNNAADNVDDWVGRSITSMSDFFTGRRTFRTKNLVRDSSVRKDLVNFQESSFMRDLNTKVNNVMSNPSSEEYKDLESRAMGSEYSNFLMDLGRNNRDLYTKLTGTLTTQISDEGVFQGVTSTRGLSSQLIDLFKSTTFGANYTEKEQVLKDIVEMNTRNISSERIEESLRFRENNRVGFVDKTSSDYKNASDKAWSANVAMIRGEDSPSGMISADSASGALNKLANSGFNKNFNELTDTEKAALNDRINADQDLRIITGGASMGVADPIGAIRGQALIEKSSALDAEISGTMNMVRQTSLAKVGEAARTITVGGEDVESNEAYMRDYVNNYFSRGGRDYGRGEMRTREENSQRITMLTEKGDKESLREAAMLRVISSESEASGLYDTMREGLTARAFVGIQDAISEKKLNLKVAEFKDENIQQLLNKSIERDLLLQAANENNIELFGEVSDSDMNRLAPKVIKAFSEAKSNDKSLGILRSTVLGNLSEQALLEKLSPGIVQRMGITTNKDEAVTETMQLLKNVIGEDGVKVTLKEDGAPWFPHTPLFQ